MMMVRRKGGAYFLCITTLLSLGALGDAAAAPMTQIAGGGALPCSEYVDAVNHKDPVAFAYFEWAQGFFTALNIMRGTEKKTIRVLLTQKYTIRIQAAFLYGYCKKHPQENFVSSSIALYSNLPVDQ